MIHINVNFLVSVIIMSLILLKDHLKSYHNYRFAEDIKQNPSKNDVDDSIYHKPQSEKLIGRKMRKILKSERKHVIEYQQNLTKNVEQNIILLKRLSIQTQQNPEVWDERLKLIREVIFVIFCYCCILH